MPIVCSFRKPFLSIHVKFLKQFNVFERADYKMIQEEALLRTQHNAKQ
jgi:hypothetical protein